jgi:hypothetical protein
VAELVEQRQRALPPGSGERARRATTDNRHVRLSVAVSRLTDVLADLRALSNRGRRPT